MRKHGLIILAISLMCFMPFTRVEAAETACSKEVLEQYRKELANTTLTYEYVPNGTLVQNGEEFDISNKIKVEIENLPDNYYAILSYGNVFTPSLLEDYPLYLDGGVYQVTFLHVDCQTDIVKRFEVFIPSYNKNKEDKWFDGTYEQSKKDDKKENKQKINIILIIGVSSLIIILIVLIIFLLNRKKRFE